MAPKGSHWTTTYGHEEVEVDTVGSRGRKMTGYSFGRLHPAPTSGVFFTAWEHGHGDYGKLQHGSALEVG